MKLTRFFQHLSVMALCAATALPVFAQSPSAKPLPAPGGLPGGPGNAANPASALTPPPSATPGFSCEVPAGQLAEALATVTRAAEARGVEMPNALFAADTAEMKVPRLKLRSVTPSGALSLLAAAAGCDVEQVVTPDTGEISGWMFKAKPPQRGWLKSMQGAREGGSYYEKSVPGAGADQLQSAPAGGDALKQVVPSRTSSGKQDSGGANLPVDKLTISPNYYSAPSVELRASDPSLVLGMGGGSPSQAPVTRVYAVGLLLDEAKPDAAKLLQATLQNVLEVAAGDEKPRTPPSLSFHDGTKLIVAKATPEAQVLIEQTLKAMTQNANDLKSGRKAVNALRLWREGEGSGRAEPAPKGEEKTVTPGDPPPSSQPPRTR